MDFKPAPPKKLNYAKKPPKAPDVPKEVEKENKEVPAEMAATARKEHCETQKPAPVAVEEI